MARARARTPTRNLAPPMPPERTTIRMEFILPHGYDKSARRVSVAHARAVYAGPTPPIVRQGEPVTSQPQPVPGEVKSAGQYLRPLRDLAAYVLVGANAVFLFLAIVDLIGSGFGYRTMGSFGSFINLVTIGFPLAAVLLALLVQPRHPKAQLIVASAAVEYAVMALFGIFFGVLIGLI